MDNETNLISKITCWQVDSTFLLFFPDGFLPHSHLPSYNNYAAENIWLINTFIWKILRMSECTDHNYIPWEWKSKQNWLSFVLWWNLHSSWERQSAEIKYINTWEISGRDFPGGPLFSTPFFQCKGCGFDPWSGWGN